MEAEPEIQAENDSEPLSAPVSSSSTSPPDPDIVEKYKNLKKRYRELEEKYKETTSELQRSSERNVKIREERNILLERILELEAQQPEIKTNGISDAVAQPESSAFPRSLLSARSRTDFVNNLRQAEAEGEAGEDEDVDPVTSRHIGGKQRVSDRLDAGVATTETTEAARGTKRTREKSKSSSSRSRRRTKTSSHPDESSLSTSELVGSSLSSDEDSPEMPETDEYTPPRKQPKIGHLPAYVSSSNSGVSGVRRSSRPKRNGATINYSEEDPLEEAQEARSTRSRASRVSTSRVSSPATGSKRMVPSQVPSIPPNPALEPRYPVSSLPSTSRAVSATPSTSSTGGFNPYSIYHQSGPSPPVTPTSYNPYSHLAGSAANTGNPMFPPSPSNCYPGPVPGPVQRQQTRPKRLKAHTVISKLHNIPMVPRDKNNKPMLPLNVGIMTVISLGTVCMREHFHTERYIFPVGYEVSRRYLSTLDPNIEVVYHCTILDGGDGPKFQIIPSDVPEHPVMAGTASGAWASIVKQANAIRNRQHSNSVSGPDFFGLGQNTIKHLIQELPNSNKLRDYVWQQFVEGGQLGGRHAAVIPALPEDYDAVHPIRPCYPAEPKQNTPLPESPRSHYPPHVVAQQTSSSSMAPPQRHPSDQFMQRQSSEGMYLEQYDTGYDRNSYLDESSHHVPPTFASIMHAHASYHPSDPLA